MKPEPDQESFEQRLQRQSWRPIPAEWRAEILSAARNAAPSAESATLTRRAPAPVSPHSRSRSWWQELLWPSPWAWGGLTAVWLLLLGIHSQTFSGPTLSMSRKTAPDPAKVRSLQEEARLLAELLNNQPTPQATLPPEPTRVQPRSERRPNWRLA
jgi:hypothetical protein